MGAILAMPVAVCCESFTAVGAGEGINGGLSPLNGILVLVPPFLTALAGAELYGFDTGLLMNRSAAVFAEYSIRSRRSRITDFSIQSVPVTVGDNLVLGKSKSICYFLVSELLRTELCNFVFLFGCHMYPTSYFSLEKMRRFERRKIKKCSSPQLGDEHRISAVTVR
jgi:hypothetical protein